MKNMSMFPMKKKKSYELEELQDPDEPIEDIQVRIAKTNPELIPEMDFLPDEENLSLENLQDPEETALAGLKAHLTKRPDRRDYRPSGGRKILSGLAAALAAASGTNPMQAAQFARDRNNRKFTEANEDWMLEGNKLKELAQIEERSNTAKENRAMREAQFKESAAQRQADRDARLEGQEKDRTLRKEIEAGRNEDRDAMRGMMGTMKGNAAEEKKIKDIAMREDAARGEYVRRTKEHDASRRDNQKVKNLAKQVGSVAELSQLMSLVSSIDDTAAREGEVNAQRAARSLMERISLWTTRLDKSAAVTPEMRKEIEAASDAIASAMQSDRKQLHREYADLAKRRGYDVRNIVPDYEEEGTDDDATVDAWLKANGLVK